MSNNVTADTELTHKFVAVLNRKIPIPKLLNALGHMAAGLSVSYSNIKEMRFEDYIDADGGHHKSISDNGFIILQADNSNWRYLNTKDWLQSVPKKYFVLSWTFCLGNTKINVR